MVAGKVKMAMGLQKSPVNPNPNTNTNPNPKSKRMNPDSSPLFSSASSANAQKGGGQGFSRSFGAYFPRASAQVQPRPPDVTELLRLVEELRERESLLKTEILEMKLLKESAAILPVLEKEISLKDCEIEKSKRKIECLEAENESLRRESEILHMELSRQNGRFEEKLKNLEGQIAELKKLQENSSFNKVSKNLWKCSSLSSSNAQAIYEIAASNSKSKKEENGIEIERPRHSRCDSEEILETSDSVMSLRSRVPRVPKPPPRPSLSSVASSVASSTNSSSPPSYGSLTESAKRALTEISNIPPPPPLPQLKVSAPPPPPYPPHTVAKTVAPPPPPPPPTKGFKTVSSKVSRVPEVVEFYHSLMRRDSRRDSSATGGGGAGEGPATAKDMIGEIENRSAHLLAIKTDVETQGDFIRSLIKEVENAAFIDIEDVVPFVKWLDDELSYLVDERAVLKHFDWPEQKADTLREAAFGYCDLKKLESEVSSFRDDLRQPCASALKKMQSLFEKLEHGLYNLSRTRESATNRYKGFHIPIEWMLDSGQSINQIKLASVKLAMKYMKRVSAELETVGGGCPEEEELIVQAVKFAFRVHQFAGGFDVETMRAFQELRCHIQCQNQLLHHHNHNHKHLSNSSRTTAY